MDILARLNSGALHDKARASRLDCVDSLGNVHSSPERARFVEWRRKVARLYGDDVNAWPECAKAEYRMKHVPQ